MGACFRLIVLDTDVVRRQCCSVWAAATSPNPSISLFVFCDSLPPTKFAPETYAVLLLFIFLILFCGFIGSPLFCVHSDAFVFVPSLSVVYCSPRCALTMFCCKFRFGFTTFVMRPFGWQFGTSIFGINAVQTSYSSPSVQLLCICLLFTCAGNKS